MSKLAVYLTVYKRLENLPKTLESLQNQVNKDYDLFIINNSAQEINSLVKNKGEIINMKNEYKMYGRFLAVRDNLHRGHEKIAFLDDDISIPTTYIRRCHRHYDPQYIKSIWAFTITTDYWNRKKIRGQTNGHYAGTGGLLAPAELFKTKELYQCPPEYWIMDDIWMSHVIQANTNYKIRNFPLPFQFINDEKATYKSLIKQKSEMAKNYLIPYINKE